MEQLSAKLKNTPRDTSLVPCSANSSLNSDLSDEDIARELTDNNPEENQRQLVGGPKAKTLVKYKGYWYGSSQKRPQNHCHKVL